MHPHVTQPLPPDLAFALDADLGDDAAAVGRGPWRARALAVGVGTAVLAVAVLVGAQLGFGAGTGSTGGAVAGGGAVPTVAATTWTPQAGVPKPGTAVLPRQAATQQAAHVAATGDLQGYTFPELGAGTYSDDWGAARADTGAHQGNDLFAPVGTPIVAVADGTLDRVGWNAIGGYRVWLFDGYGNGFYMAHLSAYAPGAVDGARVLAGQVIGFVGDTGDAQGTPSHLHFEVHPGNGAAVDPFPYLQQWLRGTAEPVDAGAAAAATPLGSQTAAASNLTGAADIAANSGLSSDEAFAQVRPTSAPTSVAPAPVATPDPGTGADS